MAGSAVKVQTFTAAGAGTTTADVPIAEQGLDTNGTLLVVVIQLSAFTGTTPTLDVSVTWSGDGVTFVAADGTADSFAQITTAVGKAKQFTVKGAYARVSAVIAGTTPALTGAIYTRVL